MVPFSFFMHDCFLSKAPSIMFVSQLHCKVTQCEGFDREKDECILHTKMPLMLIIIWIFASGPYLFLIHSHYHWHAHKHAVNLQNLSIAHTTLYAQYCFCCYRVFVKKEQVYIFTEMCKQKARSFLIWGCTYS